MDWILCDDRLVGNLWADSSVRRYHPSRFSRSIIRRKSDAESRSFCGALLRRLVGRRRSPTAAVRRAVRPVRGADAGMLAGLPSLGTSDRS
jgi:hypothetical protein